MLILPIKKLLFKVSSDAYKIFIISTLPRNVSTHKRWMRPYLKDIFHRRIIAGPDPDISRSAKENWNYSSEISALSNRLQIAEIDDEITLQAVTNKTFFERSDVGGGASFAQPSMEENQIIQSSCNEMMTHKGASLFRHVLLTYLRAHWSSSPEEFIIGVAKRIASNNVLTEIANHLGIQHVVRTGEYPPSEKTLHMALFSLFGIMDLSRARSFIREFILPRLHDLPMEDILPFKHPYPILCDYFYKLEKITDLEPRIISSGAVATSIPYYNVAIYANKDRIVGQSAGELPWVAFDLAAQNALLQIWKVCNDDVFPFKFEQAYLHKFERAQYENHTLKDICSSSTDIELYTNEELARDPIDFHKMAHSYLTNIKPVLGIPHRKRLRHMFARGTISKITRRCLVKPQPHNI